MTAKEGKEKILKPVIGKFNLLHVSNDSGIRPVSYTHLDVYKRQGERERECVCKRVWVQTKIEVLVCLLDS